MSDRELGKKIVEEMELELFLREYEWLTGLTFSFPIGRWERPDFIALRSDGAEVGIEVVKVMRDPESAHWDRTFRGMEFEDPLEMAIRLQENLYRKDKKRAEPDWHHADRTILVLMLMDSPVDEVAEFLDDEILQEMSDTGFFEIWLADYTVEDAYGTVQLFGVKPEEWQGLHEHSMMGKKPFG